MSLKYKKDLPTDLKRAILVSDTHFGVRNSSNEWLTMIKSYFTDFFIPLLKKDYRPGDFVLHCGDVFDSRHSLNLLVMTETIEVFEKMAEIMPVVIILGNHDVYRKESNEVNSSKSLKWIPNVFIFEEPDIIHAGGKKLLLMPWRKSVEDENECISSYNADYLFCHTEVRGLKMGRYTSSEEGIVLDNLDKFKRVYSGHIHYAQKKDNFRMVGCPYQLTRGDIGNEKGIWKVDFENDTEEYVKNDFSPQFIRILFEKILDMEISEVNALFANNFIDILVHPKWSMSFPFSSFSEDLETTYRKLEFIPRTSEVDDQGFNIDEENVIEDFDILTLAEKAINSSSHDDKIKDMLLSTIKKLYASVTNETELE